MRIKRTQLFDILIYLCCIVFVIFDYICCISTDTSIVVLLSFLPILVLCVYTFIKSEGFLTIDQMLCIFIFVFCYYTPMHQLVERVNIHSYTTRTTYSNTDYLYANFVILLFFLLYFFTRKYEAKSQKMRSYKLIIRVNTLTLFVLKIISIGSLLWLLKNNALLNYSDSNNNGDSLGIIVLKIVRFLPISALLLSLMSIKDNVITGKKNVNLMCVGVIGFVCAIIFFPMNGTLSRYLLFGTYLMILHTIFENSNHKAYIILATFVGFYFIFPAFNFFKYNNFSNIAAFKFGGFNASHIDYDAYQMLMQTIHYVDKYGILWCMNIVSALGCVIPRSIWSGKLNHSGTIIADSYNASFNNLSCPIFAESYLALGVIGVAIFGVLFAKLINIFEVGNKTDNSFFRAMYAIAVGMIIPFTRGALLPMTSFWVCLTISLVICSFICVMCTKGKKVKKNENSM